GERAVGRIPHVDVHLRVVVPRVAAFLTRGAEGQLLGLQLRRPGIVMGGREQDVAGHGAEERACGLSGPRRYPLRVARGEVERIDLVERIARLPLALKHELAPVAGPVPLASTSPVEGETPHAAEERTLTLASTRILPRDPG